MLDQLAKYLERDLEARRRITPALIYPVVIAALALFTVVVLAGFVLPKFRTFFEGLDAELPLAPRDAARASPTSSLGWWWALIGGVRGDRPGRPARAADQGRPVRLGQVPAAAFRSSARPSGSPWSSDSAGCSPSMASAGVALPEALARRHRVACATGSSSAPSARVSEAMLEGQGLARAAVADEALPGYGRADDPGGRGDRNARDCSSR